MGVNLVGGDGVMVMRMMEEVICVIIIYRRMISWLILGICQQFCGVLCLG